jgi:Leucine-rich repeat (LRR) protein
LQVLWLADNYISSLSGLSALQQLQQLNLARNEISSVGSSLLSHTALTSLNLADNKISNFQVQARSSAGRAGCHLTSRNTPAAYENQGTILSTSKCTACNRLMPAICFWLVILLLLLSGCGQPG